MLFLLVFDNFLNSFGQVEPGEDVQATAVRELEEESGLVASTESLQKVGHFQYEFSDTNILPCIMEVRPIFSLTLFIYLWE
jgi:8-oxo-dGTP pyrophosphatase MutT (NUDIX family)